jgi:hypothetical protein
VRNELLATLEVWLDEETRLIGDFERRLAEARRNILAFPNREPA